MKKTKIMVMTATIVLGIGTAAHAELPLNSIIVGNEAYSLGYLQNDSDVVNQLVMNHLDNLYYVDGTGTAKDIFSGATVSESQLVSKIGTTITSYNDSGVATKYTSNSSKVYQKPNNNNNYDSYIVADANYSNVTTGLYLVYLKLRNVVGAKDATYYTVGSTSSSDTSNLISISSQATFFSASSGDVKTITIYDSNKTAIYSGNLVISIDATKKSGSDTETVALLAYPDVNQSDVTQPGNLNGNITNTGLAAIDYNQKYIYYINITDKNKLYRQSVDGLENSPIADDSVGYINVVGNWVYYINYSDKGKIYKVKVDGTGGQKVTDDIASGLFVYGDNVFYINHSDDGKIYVINSEGKMKLTSDTADNINVVGNASGAVIYYKNASSGGKLYKAIYSTASTSVSNQKMTEIPAEFINALSQYNVYYTSSDSKLYKLNGNSSSPVKIVTNVTKGKGNSASITSTEEKLSVICVDSEGNIYYRSNVDGGKLYKVDSDNNGYKLVDSAVDYINIIDSSNGKLADGSSSANANTGYIYYISSKKLYRIPIDSDGTVAGQAVSKPKTTLKIKSIYAIPTVTTEDISSFNFPERVSALMSDGTIQELIANWDKTNFKFAKGIYTFTGTVLGYGNKITLNVSIATAMPTLSEVVVANNAGNKDTITVSNLKQGDIVSLYTSQDAIKPSKTATASSGIASFKGLSLDAEGGTIYVTVTTTGKAESAKLAVSYAAEAPVGFSVVAEDNQVTGLKKNKDYTIYMYDAAVTKDSNVDWDGSDSTGTKTKPVTLSVTSDASGTIDLTKQTSSNTFESIVKNNSGKDMIFRIKQNGTSSTADSSLSSSITVSKAKVQDYITIDYTSGVINGTDTTMQYSYVEPDPTAFDKSQWVDCKNGMTKVDLNMYLEVWVRIKGSGPTLSSKPKGLSLFAPPTVTGIVDGKMYSGDNKPKPTWNVTSNDDATNIVLTRIAVYDSNEQDDTQWETVTGFDTTDNIASGAEINVTNTEFSSDKTYAFILTQTKTVDEKIGTAKVIIKFKVNSSKPANVDISMKESKGISSLDELPVYYEATPQWLAFAGTYDKISLYRLDTQDTLPSTLIKDDFTSAATIDFAKGNTISQPGYYMLEVVTTNSQNGAKTTTDKFFVIDPTVVTPVSLATIGTTDDPPFMNGANYSNIAIKPTLGTDTKYSVDRSTWKSWLEVTNDSDDIKTMKLLGGVYVWDGSTNNDGSNKNESFVSAQIMGDSGAYINYQFGQNISVNATYNLSVKTTSDLNGNYKTNTYGFTVKNGTQIQDPPNVTLSVNDSGKFVFAQGDQDMTLMQYSVDGGTSWNAISGSSTYTILDAITSKINATNGVRVKVKAYGSYPESQQQLIAVQKKDTPVDIKFAFTTTSSAVGVNTTTADFTVGTVPTDIADCEYSTDGGKNWTSIEGESIGDVPTLITNLNKNNVDILVRQKASGGSESSDLSIPSSSIAMGVWRPTAPSSVTVIVDTADPSKYKLSASSTATSLEDVEYSLDTGTTWASGTTSFSSTTKASVLIRIKGSGVRMPSITTTITVP